MPRAQLSDVELEAMRTRLSSAGLDVYRQEGLEAVSFRRLAELLDVSHTLPYRYFQNKDALLARMRADALGRFESYVREHESRADGPLAQVHAVADAYIAFASRHQAEYLLIFATHQPAPELYPEVLQARRQVFDHAVEVLQRCIDAGLLRGEALELAHALWIGLHGLMTLHVAGQLVHGRTLDELVEPLLGRLLNAAKP